MEWVSDLGLADWMIFVLGMAWILSKGLDRYWTKGENDEDSKQNKEILDLRVEFDDLANRVLGLETLVRGTDANPEDGLGYKIARQNDKLVNIETKLNAYHRRLDG